MMNADGYEVSLVNDDDDNHSQEEQSSRPHLAARTSMGCDQEENTHEVTRDVSHASTETFKLAPSHLMDGEKALVDGTQEAELVEKGGIKKDLTLQAIQHQALEEALEEEKKDDSSCSGHLVIEPSSSSSVAEDVEVQLKDSPPRRTKTKTDVDTSSHSLPQKDLEVISAVTDSESSRLREDVPPGVPSLSEEAPPPPPLSSAASPNLQQSLQLVAAESAGTAGTDYSEGAPTMVGVGIPQPQLPQRILTRPPSTRSVCRGGEETEESKEEIFGPSRPRTTDELTQEAIDESLAENQAINAQNDKDGKKFLPDVDPTAIVRRQSSRMSCLSIDKCNMSYQTSAEFSVDGSSRRLDGSSHHSSLRHRGHSPTPNSHNSSSSDRSPAYGSRPRQGLFEDDDDPELATAYAATALPGAYSMPGFGLEADSSTAEQASTIVNEPFYDESGEAPAPPTGPLIQESVLVTARRQEAALFVEGENVVEGLTDEQRIIAKRRFIKTQVFYGVCMLLIAIMVSTIVVLVKRDPGPPTDDIVWVPVGEEASGPGVDDGLSFGFSVSLSGDGRRFCAGMPGYDASETQSDVGQVQIFDLADDNEEWLASATIDFGFKGRAGEAVALSKNGRRVVVGSPGWADESGLLSVFEDDGDNSWFQIGEEISGVQSDGDARLGTSVDISADGQVVAGAAPFSIDGGVVRVYEEVNSVWVRMGAAIVATTTQSLFGSSISLSSDGRRIAIGARNVGMGEGQVSVYDFNGTHWNQAGQTLNGSTDFESFGYAVSLNGAGDLLAVGAIGSPGQDSGFNSGKVQVFEYVSASSSWSQVGDDILGRRSESLGSSVSLSDNGILAIGSPQRPQVQETGKVGVYFFTPSKGWDRVENEILGSLESESFGSSVSISSDGNFVAVGAPDADYDGRLNQVGKVRVFNNTNAPDYPTTAM